MIRRGLLAVALLVAGCRGLTATAAPVLMGPPVECVGIPAQTCQQIVADARGNAEPGTVPVRIRAVCTALPCTPQRGDVSVEVVYSNGRTDTYGMGWSSAPEPVPPIGPAELPVEPVCQGVPQGPCRDRALETVGADPNRAAIRGILVRCTAASCTDASGTGQTIVTYGDGGTSTSDWGYETGG